MRNRLALGCCAFFAFCFSATASAEDSSNSDAFSRTVIADIDLTQPFGTKSSWRFVVTQEPDEHYGPDEDYPGDIYFCFVRDNKPDCSEPSAFNTLDRADVVYPIKGSRTASLIVVANDFSGGPGSFNFTTIVWAYRPKSDKFERVFSRASYANINEETRLVTNGPLAGDIIVSVSLRRAPYRYGIEVYRSAKSADFIQVLKYSGKTKWDDGNGLAVIDSEMPAILRRLHLWKSGDPLPEPERKPPWCKTLELHKDGTEWCIGATDSKP